MTAVLTRPDTEQRNAPAATPQTTRRCLVSGEDKPKTDLIRFVLDPEGRVVPDLTERLPGRGLWVSADRASLAEAVRKNVFSRGAKTKAKVDPELVDLTADLLRRRCLELLGLAKAARAVVTREPVVLDALAKGGLTAVLLASDAGNDIRKKLSRSPSLFTGFTRSALGEALGREHLVAVGLRPHPLSDRLQIELARWQGACASSPDFQQSKNGSSENT